MNNWLDMNHSFELNPFNRLILYKIYQILEKLDPINAEMHRLHQKIVRDGLDTQNHILLEEMTLEYDKIPSDVTDFVEAVIGMYAHMSKSYAALSKEEIIVLKEHPYYSFLGFNLNEETHYEMYAFFYLIEMRHYEGQLDLSLFSNIATKPCSLKVYQRMLEVYEFNKIDTYLSFEVLCQILK
ncbi:YfbU family protein [Macrococcoides caseolyticum]|uniref:YfbU family protein n=1 Tax=Macrococcoides caseolyticum TaxID=69966 RepID=UPI001F19F892|nr:YfbU family protein [Macrococcus caseolyticus]MCE4956711.1 YfbU family protein [Macrococcus caseolyticus]